MAQGGKLKKLGGGLKKKSSASVKKQQKKQLTKGRKTFKAKGRKAIQTQQIQDATKAINKKNEVMAASRAVSAGNTFFMTEMKEKGKQELHRAKASQIKKERGANKLTSRLKQTLRKMGKDV
jgi:hypothetical protein